MTKEIEEKMGGLLNIHEIIISSRFTEFSSLEEKLEQFNISYE